MSLRTLLVLFIVAILTIVPVSAQDDMMTIDFWRGLTGPDGAFLEDMVNTYNETNEDGIFVQLNVFHWDVFFDRWVASVAAGDPPDVVIYHINEMPQYAEAGVVTPIKELIEEVGVDMSEFSDVIMDMSMFGGKLYGFPIDIHPIGMYYNVDAVEAAGLDPDSPPSNAEELLSWAEALTVDSDGDGTNDQYGVSAPAVNVMTFRLWWSLIFQNGGSFISDDLSTITIDNAEAAEALESLRDLDHVHGVAPEGQSDPDTDFLTGSVAITFQGPWWINGFVDAGLNFRTAPVPTLFDAPGVWASSHYFGFSVQDDTDSQIASNEVRKLDERQRRALGSVGSDPSQRNSSR